MAARRIDQDSGRYEIVVDGHLDSRRAGWFNGLDLEQLPDGTTRLCGPVADQAALHSLLSQVRDLGVALLSVRRLERQNGGRNDD